VSVKIPYQQTDDRQFNQFQVALGKALSPVVGNPINFGLQLNSVALSASQTNSIPHMLDRNLIGWFIVRQRANSVVWDAQDSNTTPSQTLSLNCSADTTVDIWVF
jgi:hypothetical protein